MVPTTARIVCTLVASIGFLPAQDLEQRNLSIDGTEREYLLYLPSDWPGDSAQRSLVLMMHGRGSSPRQASRVYGWMEKADDEGFAVAFPAALGRPRSWDPGYFQSEGTSRRDLDFLVELIGTLREELEVPAGRVFATGHSSGAIMSYALAGWHSDLVAAIGPVAGTIGIRRANLERTVPAPERPVAVISFHGEQDRVIAYDPERHKAIYDFFLSAPESVAHFARANGCAAEPEESEMGRGTIACSRYLPGEDGAPVVLYSLREGGHEWPRRHLNATDLIWEFFALNTRKAAMPASGR